jgi:hypothetical protein
MKQLEVTAKKGEASATIFVNVPEDLEEGIEMYGEDAILSNALASGKITIQAGMRTALAAGKDSEAIQAQYNDWKLGVHQKGGGFDPIAASLNKFAQMSPEDQAAYLEQLKARAAQE